MSAPAVQTPLAAGSETSCAWPAGHAAGDWALLPVQTTSGTVTTPTGCAIVAGSPYAGPEGLALFTKKAASGAEAALALAGGSDHLWGNIVTVRSAHQVFPIHAISSSSRPSGAATLNMVGGVDVTIDLVAVVDVFAWNLDSAGPLVSASTNGSLTGYGEIADAGTVTGDGGGLWMGSGTKAVPGFVDLSSLTTTSTSGLAVKVAFAPIADIAINGTVTIDGAAAPNSFGGNPKVYLYDLTQPAADYLVLDAATETNVYSLISGGTGAFAFKVPYNNHDYVAVYQDASGALYGASQKLTFGGGAFPAAVITIKTGGGAGDTTPPTITIVSPTPGTAPGAPGGFSSDWQTARNTPIVLDVTDVTPGVAYHCLVCRYPGATDEITVYRHGAFRGQFVGRSSTQSIANGLRFTILPLNGWPSSDVLNDVTFEIDAIDGVGNIAS